MAILERSHLEIIRAVDQHGSLTAAAEELHLTQSALSHTIRKLESQLDIAIWYREGRNLRPTQAGEYLLAVANRLLPQLNYAEDRLKQFAKGERGTLRIGMECHPCYQWLLKIVSPYLAQWPSGEAELDDILIEGPFGIKIVPATSGTQSMTELSPAEHAGLIRAFSELRTSFDVLLVDTAAGISDMVLSFSRASQDV